MLPPTFSTLSSTHSFDSVPLVVVVPCRAHGDEIVGALAYRDIDTCRRAPQLAPIVIVKAATPTLTIVPPPSLLMENLADMLWRQGR
eukprot:COSAG02_NODE_58192_length_278_cov_0.581006_1_plen_86_part_10